MFLIILCPFRNKKVCLKTNKTLENSHQFLDFCRIQFNINIDIFKYLELQDLLRVQNVCKMWKCYANDYSLWKTVRVSDKIKVKNWDAFADTLYKRNTEKLDLRKMQATKVSHDSWLEFLSAVPKIKTIIEIDLCKCPNSVVHGLLENCPNLEILKVSRCKISDLKPAYSGANSDKIYNELQFNIKLGTIQSEDNIVLA